MSSMSLNWWFAPHGASVYPTVKRKGVMIMCMDPLSRVQLLVAEAIDALSLSCEKHTADPAVVEAVLSRLREARQQLGRAQASHSRRQAWRLTRDAIVRVATELAVRALMTTNCTLADVL